MPLPISPVIRAIRNTTLSWGRDYGVPPSFAFQREWTKDSLRSADFLVRRSDGVELYIEVWAVFLGNVFYMDDSNSSYCPKNSIEIVDVNNL